MKHLLMTSATIKPITPQLLALSGCWTARGIADMEPQLAAVSPGSSELVIDSAHIAALDSVGAWVLQQFLHRLEGGGSRVQLRDLRPEFARLLALAAQQIAHQTTQPPAPVNAALSKLQALGRFTVEAFAQSLALLSFIGATTLAFAGCLAHPKRMRWRPILFNIRSAGFDALPIVGLLSFMLGVVVAYQGADQLKLYGANIFVADLVGLSILREFAPLITAIIIAGRSGSAYAAQIGTMVVTEEIDAMHTIGIAPLELLVLPKIIALLIALPLLTVFADVLGVFGGMMMAHTQLGVGFGEFIDRFIKVVTLSSYMVGIGKAPVFAVIIAIVGCFQGFRTQGGAESVGRQTTRSVVQSIFLVIVVDGLFSVAFSVLDL